MRLQCQLRMIYNLALIPKNHSCSYCSDPLVGEELYTQMGFFVQSNLADRYIHRREL